MRTPPRFPAHQYVFRSKRLRTLRDLFLWGALLAWFAWGGLVTTWSGHRPLAPSPATGQVIPYVNHGVLFVSQRDLDTTHLLLAICAACGLLALGCYLIDRKPWRKPGV